MTHRTVPDRLILGQILHFLDDPGEGDDPHSYAHFPQGALWIVEGRVAAVGHRRAVESAIAPERLAAAERFDYGDRLVLPGLVDTHCHYPQSAVIASFGRQLLDWLNTYTFPAEMAFRDPEVARATARYFLDRLLAHGTTTASVFATVHAASVEAFMAEADARQLRMLTGKVMMDRHAPPELCDTVADAERDCVALIERWHGRGRLRYTITPRFAPTSTSAQLALAGELYASRPDLHVQSHLAENPDEIAWVKALFPECRDYLDVYARHGLLGPRTIYGHCIHLSGAERAEMAATGTAAAFCPTSNLFLGSGFFDHAASVEAGLRVGLATDVGGGSSFSLIRTLDEAYKVSQVHRRPLSPLRAWYLATLAGARALYLDAFIGNFEVGKEADCVVLDERATPELEFRLRGVTGLAERLFALTVLGDERCVVATHVLGAPAFQR
ncbi:MAG TPA: guanine deaminase [Rhodocyclaceae bacterium]|uniref:guanine deaminase n=1 Tax=Zoogloea sp. TaxID=49181 RepID=UPI002C8FB36E|nr:guanine deaminase [Zoogloea sp.]HMV61782.1 guanine deaminase [Rhodocyclaceae bacterium]HMY48405.1 guanine deaminase [Rhodocyclaceae bacterium]HMZ75592.1 guanine deaminase [Rhodocyclaceae bacterium]HNB63130.1 guanine deaminase [Rhodocyclaceae bacterium]HNC77965.1 guanine deaminase [Rhodocyclaceae bacterium]